MTSGSHPDGVNNIDMSKRECLQCGGELVMSFRPSENAHFNLRVGSTKNNAKWRCGTCGQTFTAAQLRTVKKASLKVVENP